MPEEVEKNEFVLPPQESSESFLWADKLKEAIDNVRVVREPLIEHILYKKSAQMMYAPDGVGKSLVALQMLMQATVDNSRVFGEFHVPKGIRVLQLQMERDDDETLERLKTMSARTAFNQDNFVLYTGLQGLDIADRHDFKTVLHKIENVLKNSFGLPDVINIDPANAILGTDMITNRDIAPLTNLSRMLQKQYGCSIHIVHHANRGQRDESGKRQHADMFGSRFMSAHFTGIYKLEALPDDSGVTLTADKSSQKNLEKKIDLAFDVESQLCWLKYPSGMVSKKDKLYAYFRACKTTKKSFTMQEMMMASGLSHGSIRNMSSLQLKNDLKISGKSNDGKILYEYTGA